MGRENVLIDAEHVSIPRGLPIDAAVREYVLVEHESIPRGLPVNIAVLRKRGFAAEYIERIGAPVGLVDGTTVSTLRCCVIPSGHS